MQRKPTPGINIRHSRRCAGNASCTCEPTYRPWVYDPRGGKDGTGGKVYPPEPFATLAAAKSWRADRLAAQGKGKNIIPARETFREVGEQFLAGAKAEPPTVLNRSGLAYKPSALRGIEQDLTRYAFPEIGAYKLSALRRGTLQAFVAHLIGKGLSGSKVRNVIVSVRVVFRYAIELEKIEENPTTGLRLPNGVGKRDRAASPEEAAELLEALPEDLRPIYATAFYGGLRRGELRGLRWSDVDLASGIITVRRSWDDYAGAIEPKSEKGRRTVPIVALLRDELLDLKARTNRDGSDFVFGSTADHPFTSTWIRKLALRAWTAENLKRAEKELPPLVPIGLHECRHTFVSLMHDAGLSLERIGDYVGHSSAYMTDRYRHLLVGHEAEAARMMDAYLARADSRSRLEQLEED